MKGYCSVDKLDALTAKIDRKFKTGTFSVLIILVHSAFEKKHLHILLPTVLNINTDTNATIVQICALILKILVSNGNAIKESFLRSVFVASKLLAMPHFQEWTRGERYGPNSYLFSAAKARAEEAIQKCRILHSCSNIRRYHSQNKSNCGKL